MEIKPIETIYKGIKFRSRLEARWAVFFDACGVEWEYEPEGFKLPDGTCYLPDFKLKNVQTNHASSKLLENLWVEIKGELSDEDRMKIYKFSNPHEEDEDGPWYSQIVVDHPVLILGSLPKGDNIGQLIFDIMHKQGKNEDVMFNFETIDGDYFGLIPCFNSDTGFTLNGFDSNYLDTVDEERTMQAYLKALQARFEHGEKPL